MSSPSSPPELDQIIALVGAVDHGASAASRDRQLRLTKPAGSLGRLEEVGAQLAAIAACPIPPLPEPAAVAVFAGDHGVHTEGVSPWPQEVTAQMVANICSGGAAINVIGRANDITVLAVNVGVATPVEDHPDLHNQPIARGTQNLLTGPAMTVDEAIRAILLGADVATGLIDDGYRCLLTGDMGIANTTPATSLIAAFCGQSPGLITGRGTGIDDETLALKTDIINRALDRLAQRLGSRTVSPVEILAEVGGLEIAALCGFCLVGAARRVPVIVDGVIALAGAVVAAELQPLVVGYLIGGHRSVEPAASSALEYLGVEPLVDLDLRLGEGTGAALAYPLVRAAAAVLVQMATFDAAGVAEG
ncbi:MAG: nicotinate-nucleotide--dimethylbenzimidazole phosphoribosyltransferase [Actinomycetia bacterium]|nr:nicotinate-nucleotide--dimethylbenzimidazole phosphoribosyltransferase [Actinomycetes bacterium]MCP4222780.1 nicotinate-nucleotide--dimethylbenzimidazole phosphoribosyltransferase [Actinomycetes bacterium]MCP5031260.1 nicotinate-nucleotide--dimethylbenzimidazole phosphoribosyltransferase [Actinomycetes bacterium]